MSEIRVSAAASARIMIDGRYLLHRSPGKFVNNGITVYLPAGGALKVYASGKRFLGGLSAEFQQGDDLRFRLPEGNIFFFETWFYARDHVQRETTVFREVEEELRIAKLLDLGSQQLVESYVRTNIQRQASNKPGHEGEMTQRYLELMEVFLDDSVQDLIQRRLNSNGWFVLASADQIREGFYQGDKIASTCKLLLD